MEKIWQVKVKRADGSVLFDVLVSSKEEAVKLINRLFDKELEGAELNSKYYRLAMKTIGGCIYDVTLQERPVFDKMTEENVKFINSMMF